MNKNDIFNTDAPETSPNNDENIIDNENIISSNDENEEVDNNMQNDFSVIPPPSLSEDNISEEPHKKHFSKRNIIIVSLIIIILIVLATIFGLYAKDMSAVNDVTSKINNIGETITLDSNDAILTAQNAYSELSEKQKKKIKNYNLLTSAIDQYNQKKDEYDKFQYNLNILSATADCGVINAFGYSVFSDVSTVWRNAIYKQTDEYNNGNFDFNTAISNWYKISKEKYADMFNMTEESKSSLATHMSELKNPPSGCEKAYDALLKLYATTSNIYDLAMNPEGSYSSYTSKTQSLLSEYNTNKAILDGLTK